VLTGKPLPRLAMLALALACMPMQASAQSAVVGSDAAFATLARTQGDGRFLALPQVMFAIDRNAKPSRVHWIDTRRYAFHLEYLQARRLVLTDAEEFNETNYSSDRRRFVLGSVVRYPAMSRYGVEFWEGDRLTPELLATTMTALQASFHAPLTFKPNSDAQADVARSLGLPTIGIAEAYGSREELVLNHARGVGRLVAVAEGEEDDLLPGDIALLGTMPIALPPVAGIVSSGFTTPINHVSLLAKAWGVPNAYRSDAATRYAPLLGKQVVLDTRGGTVSLRAATAAEVAAGERQRFARAVRVPVVDLAYGGLPTLLEQDRGWAKRTGAKAANLGHVARLARDQPRAFEVPPGFSVPFAFYTRFLSANGLDREVAALLGDMRRDEPKWRKSALAALRRRIEDAPIPAADLATLVGRRRAVLGDTPVFVRSSTNAEDLPGFNGAGLYTTVPNVVDDGALARAITTVWASLWNDRAYAARERAGIDHRAALPAVLIQAGVDADAAGVMTTVDPFDPAATKQRVFIAAKRGIGIRVVEGRRVAEQVIYHPAHDSVQVLSRSDDDAMLTFAPGGGVQEVAIERGRAVLTDALVRRLALVGLEIAGAFGGRPQDIEWVVKGDRVVIVQARDYVGGAGK
jgi:rifampicin phosphotransferase